MFPTFLNQMVRGWERSCTLTTGTEEREDPYTDKVGQSQQALHSYGVSNTCGNYLRAMRSAI